MNNENLRQFKVKETKNQLSNEETQAIRLCDAYRRTHEYFRIAFPESNDEQAHEYARFIMQMVGVQWGVPLD